MENSQSLFSLITIAIVLLGAVPITAQSSLSNSSKTEKGLTNILFKPPADEQVPKDTVGAGSRYRRGRCLQEETVETSPSLSLISLVPENNYGLTLAERPTFWVYLPQTSAKQVVLSIMEQGRKHHSQTIFPLERASGVIGLQASEDSPPLEVGKNYQWAVVLVCEETPQPNDPGVVSWVRRLNLAPDMNQGTTLEQAQWYGQQGIWYDALNSLAQARKINPENQDLADIWIRLLNSVGLEEIASEQLRF